MWPSGEAWCGSCWRGELAAVGEYGTLALTEPSAAILRGEVAVPLRRDVLMPKQRSPKQSAQSKAAAALSDADAAIFERLRAWRTAQATEQGVPAYMVFSDATLRALAEAKPQSEAELSGISGIGASKLERYGTDLLGLLSA